MRKKVELNAVVAHSVLTFILDMDLVLKRVVLKRIKGI